MMSLILVVVVATTAAASHGEQNPVYRELLETGVASGEQARKLSPPTLADGMSADDQVKAVAALGGELYSFDDLTRQSVVAPQMIRVSDVDSAAGEAPLRSIDAWFVAYANLDALSDREFLGKLLESRQGSGRAARLTAEQLRARGISIAEQNADREAYGHMNYELLDKVQMNATARSFWTRTEESIVAAARVDHRFDGDAEFPNQWTLVGAAAGNDKSEKVHLYDALGLYAKITRLQRPTDALLVEYHVVFAEPTAWFGGTNQLAAKLPAVLQNQIRETRRKMMQAGGAGGKEP